MLKVDQYQHIRETFLVFKKSRRWIQREFGYHRLTIKKALEGVAPRYRRKMEITYPVMGPHHAVIREWLEKDLNAPKKQRHTARKIFERLVGERGFKGSESSVRLYVRKTRESLGCCESKAMVPLEPDMGEAEMDWGDAVVTLDGVRTKVKMFCMRSRFSGKSFVRLYANERQEMLFDGHIRAFEFFGGVFRRIIYDNMSTVVKKVLKGRRREEQAAFKQFRCYYVFESKFCNVASGNEKGGVEGLVKYSRQNYLVPIPEAKNLEELNKMLVDRCLANEDRKIAGREDRRTIAERAEIEKEVLLKLIAPFDIALPRSSKVSKYQMVQVDKNLYSVPGYVGKKVEVYLGCDQVSIYYKQKLLATHPRVFGEGRWSTDPLHYLNLLERKIGAFNSARPIRQWRTTWPPTYSSLLKKLQEREGEDVGTRQFIQILKLHLDYEPDEVAVAVELACESGTYRVEAVKLNLVHLRTTTEKHDKPLENQQVPDKARVLLPTVNVSKYDALCGGSRCMKQ